MPPVRVRVWFRVSVRIRVGGNFPRTVKTCFQRGFEFFKRDIRGSQKFTYKEKCGTVKK